MNIEKNKAIARGYIELWSSGNLALADEVLSQEFVDHTHPHRAPGPESVKQEIKVFREGFPDARITVEHMIAEGDTVAFRFTLFASNTSRNVRRFSPHWKASYLDRSRLYSHCCWQDSRVMERAGYVALG